MSLVKRQKKRQSNKEKEKNKRYSRFLKRLLPCPLPSLLVYAALSYNKPSESVCERERDEREKERSTDREKHSGVYTYLNNSYLP
jgi:hypothetical protein